MILIFHFTETSLVFTLQFYVFLESVSVILFLSLSQYPAWDFIEMHAYMSYELY